MDDPQPTPRRSWRPRISLLSVLLLMTILGMAIVIAQFWQEIGPLRKEVRALRNEVGKLSIDDRSKIHAMLVHTDEELTWKWRIWIPEGKQVAMHLQWGNVPRTGVPQRPTSTSTFGPGEGTLTLKVRRDVKGENWIANLGTTFGGSVGVDIPPDQRFFLWDQWTGAGDGVGASVAFEPDQKTIVLIRNRVAQVNNSSLINKIDGPTAGFIIWMDQH
jgi:hypothetical protein